MTSVDDERVWSNYLARYRGGEWRDRIFRDMILDDLRNMVPKPTLLEIGCGEGLDGSIPLQRSLTDTAGRFIGIEPDSQVCLGEHFTEAHSYLFEDAALKDGSVDLA